jgi:hypothetical protein
MVSIGAGGRVIMPKIIFTIYRQLVGEDNDKSLSITSFSRAGLFGGLCGFKITL